MFFKNNSWNIEETVN